MCTLYSAGVAAISLQQSLQQVAKFEEQTMSAVNVHTESFGLFLIIVRCCCVKQTRMGEQVNRSVFFLCKLFEQVV